jgi:hypothetical protein
VLRGSAESLSAAAEDFPGDGQKGAGTAVPFGHAVEAEAGGREIGGRRSETGDRRPEGGTEGFDAGLGGFEPRNDAFFEEAGDEEFHLELGGVEGLAGAVVAFFDHGAESFELAQALANGALAHVEAAGDFFHAERLLVGEEETVDLSVGLGVPEQFGEVGEDLDKAGFVISREEGAWSVERARRRGRGFEI